MIRAVVFDLGGVLFSEGKTVAMAELAKQHGYDPKVINGILYSPKSLELRKGLIADEEFWSCAQTQLPRGYDAGIIRDVWYNGYVLDPDILELVKQLRGRYRVAAFSGNIRSRIGFLEAKYRFRMLFDKEIYSFDHHVTKPDKRFVEIMVAEVGCDPEEIIYIDDNDRYAQPARDLNIHVLIYTRGEIQQLQGELRRLGVDCKPA
jgi:HAD superfamily hydrolase (TIGR01509 family)